MPLTLGQTVDGGRYTLLAKLGQGGEGSVYKVQDNRAVPGMAVTLALKEISVGGVVDPVDRADNAAAFRSEVRLLMALNHPYLTQVVNFFAEGDNYYLVMDFVDGKTLLKVREQANGPLPVNTVLDWFWQLCDVLIYLHGLDPAIIFRDLKPGNLMVTNKEGIIKLIDFGIARFFKKDGVSADTRALGTPGYAPPEQYGRSQTDERSDIYSLGVTIYELLSNINPDEHIFNFDPLIQVNPKVPAALSAMLAKMMQLEPAARYPTMIAVRQDLAQLYPKPAHTTPPQTQRILAGASPHVPPPPPEPPPPRTPQYRPQEPLASERLNVQPIEVRQGSKPTVSGPPLAATNKPAVQQQREPASQATARDKPQKMRSGSSPLPTILIALALVGVLVGGSYFGLLPFTLPLIGKYVAAPAPDTLYPATMAAPAGVTAPTLNSRSPRGQWWMRGYDWGASGFSHERGPAIAGVPSWSYEINTTGYVPSNLIVASEGYYIIFPGQTAQGAGSIALALDSSGQAAWSFDLPDAGAQAMNHLAYARTTDRTFLYLQDGNGQLYASDPAAQGRATWRFDLGAASPYAPLVANGVLYASSPLTLTALDAATGTPMWQVAGEMQSATLLSPDAAQVYVVRGGKLTTLSPSDGKVQWQSDALPTAPISATYRLLVSGDTVYVGTASGVLSFERSNGERLSQFAVGGAVTGLASAGNTLYVASADQTITAQDTAGGFQRWAYTISGAPLAAPIIVGDDLYVLAVDNKLTILNARSGALVKEVMLPDMPLDSPYYANATLYYFGTKGLHALR